MARRARTLTPSALAAFSRLHTAVGALNKVDVSTSFGNPTFRVKGKAFAVIDRYRETDCLWILVAASERRELLKRAGWFPSPYDRKKTALCCSLDMFDWRRLRTLLRSSYQLAQPKATVAASPKTAQATVRSRRIRRL